MTKRTFEEYINMIELQFGIRLLDWQKTILREVYDGKHIIYAGMRNGKTVLHKAARMLKEEMDRDNGNLPPRLYELDGYSIDTVIYDEFLKEN